MMATELLSFRLLTFCGWMNINKRIDIIVKGFYIFGSQPLSTAIQSNLEDMTEEYNLTSNYDIFSWMSKFAPVFGVSGNKISIIHEPSEFYHTLKMGIKSATNRIVLSSLYLGTGKLERELTDSLYEACLRSVHSRTDKNFKVKVLLDFNRGSRGLENSRTMLLPLLSDFKNNVQVALYHTPDLRGLIKWLLPERWNEIVGLNHMKVYLFDDTLIMSGANLSEQYFANRQDRYIVIQDCQQLADFFELLVDTVSSFSLQVQADNTVALAKGWNSHPYKSNKSYYKSQVQEKIQTFYESYRQKTIDEMARVKKSTVDTWIFPLIQMGPFGIHADDHVTRQLIQQASPGTLIKLASGYFNLTQHYMDEVLYNSSSFYDMLMASPKVNGFFGAKGISGSIPTAYTYIAKLFFEQVISANQTHRIKMREYVKSKGTFHVKGLWYYLPKEYLPSMSFIGSPNFGYRSVRRDLEVQLAIVTDNLHLKEQFNKEQERLYTCSEEVTKELFERSDRHVPFWVKWVIPFAKSFL